MGGDPLDGGGVFDRGHRLHPPGAPALVPRAPFLHDIMGLLPIAVPGDPWGGCVPP